MRIIICCNMYPPDFVGGAELIAHYQAKELLRQGHDVVVFSGDIKNDGSKRHTLRTTLYDGLEVNRVHLVGEDYQNDLVNFAHPAVEDHFVDLIDRFHPQVVHFHNIIGLSVKLIGVARSRQIKTVITLHDHWGFCLKNTLTRTDGSICRNFDECEECMPYMNDRGNKIPISMRKDFFSLQMQQVDHFITPSQYLAGAYRQGGFAAEKFHTIWYGINTDRFGDLEKIPSDKVRLTYVGYFGWHKGVHILISAVAASRYKEQIEINLVGRGDELDRYKKQIKELNCENNVRFWGKVDNSDIFKVYKNTDIFVLPSIWPENQPVTINEAMLFGLPVIASRIGGCPELVEDGVTGYLFEPGNVADLAKKIDLLISNPENWKQYGDNGRAKMLQVAIENQVAKIIDVYELPTVQDVFQPGRDEKIVVCFGNYLSDDFRLAVEALKSRRGLNLRFMQVDWMDDQLFEHAFLLGVTEPGTGMQAALKAFQYQIPLLVPEASRNLKEISVLANCGLYYASALEIERCIEYLIDHPFVYQSMQKNIALVGAALDR